jgi:hypothetical protein
MIKAKMQYQYHPLSSKELQRNSNNVFIVLLLEQIQNGSASMVNKSVLNDKHMLQKLVGNVQQKIDANLPTNSLRILKRPLVSQRVLQPNPP